MIQDRFVARSRTNSLLFGPGTLSVVTFGSFGSSGNNVDEENPLLDVVDGVVLDRRRNVDAVDRVMLTWCLEVEERMIGNRVLGRGMVVGVG